MMKVLEVVSLLVVYSAICLYIMGEALTRGHVLIRGQHSYSWGLMYGLAFFFAFGELIDAWYFMSWDNTYTYESAGLLGFGFNFYLTRDLWKEGPPQSVALERRKKQTEMLHFYDRRNKTGHPT